MLFGRGGFIDIFAGILVFSMVFIFIFAGFPAIVLVSIFSGCKKSFLFKVWEV